MTDSQKELIKNVGGIVAGLGIINFLSNPGKRDTEFSAWVDMINRLHIYREKYCIKLNTKQLAELGNSMREGIGYKIYYSPKAKMFRYKKVKAQKHEPLRGYPINGPDPKPNSKF
jgi:hypothetical protein